MRRDKGENKLDLSRYQNILQTDIGSDTVAQLEHLAEIVCNKHYAYLSPLEREELRQQALLKALVIIEQGTFDPTRSSLKNYLYSAMRNEMSNIVYKKKREIPKEEFYSGEISYDLETEVMISVKVFTKFCYKYNVPVYLQKSLLANLCYMGFRIGINSIVEDYSWDYNIEKYSTLFVWYLRKENR